jgi:hypothetical protein
VKPFHTVVANVQIKTLKKYSVLQSIEKPSALRYSYKIKPQVFRFILASVALLPNLSASVYVVVKNGRVIVVGADSRTTKVIDQSKRVRGEDRCKITKCSPGSYFVISANPLINIKMGIDFSKLAATVCSGSGDTRAVATRFETEAIRAARTIYTNDKQDVVVSATFFGSNMGGAFYFTRSIRYTAKEHPYRDQPIDCAASCNGWTAGGYHEVINNALAADKAFFTRYGLVEGIRELLTDQIETDKTGEVGAPLSIIKLDGPSEAWVSPGVCVTDTSKKNGERD